MNIPLFRKGFTIVELLVVVSIIVILTGIVITSVAGPRSKTRDVQKISDMNHLQLALELYYDRCRQYPRFLDTTTNGGLGVNEGCPQAVGLSTYISKIPVAPASPSITGTYQYATNCYTNLPGCTPNDYVLRIQLERYNEALKDHTGGQKFGLNCDDGSINPDTVYEYCVSPR